MRVFLFCLLCYIVFVLPFSSCLSVFSSFFFLFEGQPSHTFTFLFNPLCALPPCCSKPSTTGGGRGDRSARHVPWDPFSPVWLPSLDGLLPPCTRLYGCVLPFGALCLGPWVARNSAYASRLPNSSPSAHGRAESHGRRVVHSSVPPIRPPLNSVSFVCYSLPHRERPRSQPSFPLPLVRDTRTADDTCRRIATPAQAQKRHALALYVVVALGSRWSG